MVRSRWRVWDLTIILGLVWSFYLCRFQAVERMIGFGSDWMVWRRNGLFHRTITNIVGDGMKTPTSPQVDGYGILRTISENIQECFDLTICFSSRSSYLKSLPSTCRNVGLFPAFSENIPDLNNFIHRLEAATLANTWEIGKTHTFDTRFEYANCEVTATRLLRIARALVITIRIC